MMLRNIIGCFGSVPPDERTVLLLHMDGANGETTFEDSSMYNVPITTNGNAHKSTSVFKFPTASCALDGSGDDLGVQSHDGFSYGTGDFTVEMWIYINSWTSNAYFIWSDATGSIQFCRDGSTSGWGLVRNGSGFIVKSNTLPSTGTWHHIMASRVSGTMRLFLDGNIVASASDTRTYVKDDYSVGGNVNGYIDEMRIRKGVGVAASFTPPADAYLT